MASERSRRHLGTIVGVALTILVAACAGGSATTSSDSGGDGNETEIFCDKDAATAGLGEGQLCVDSGFRLSSDDFSFPNWSGVDGDTDTLGTSTLISLFGAANVCSSGTTADDCVLLASAQHTLDEWASALDGGRCEGMATLSLRFFLGIDDRNVIEAGATKTVEMKRPDPALDQDINLWWATQFVPEVQEVAAASRQKTPTQLVEELAAGLASGAGYTIGIYDEGFGHAITPFAVTKVEEVFRVHVYDNNFPGEPRYIEVDAVKDEWRYEDSSVNPDGTASVWSGGTGTFELTPMNARKGPFTSPFHGTEDAKGHVVLTAVSKGAGPSATHRHGVSAGLLVTTASGKSVGVQEGKIVNEIPGAHYTIGKGGKGHSLVTVRIPAEEEFGVQVVAGSERAPDANSPSHEVSVTVKTKDGTHTKVKARHSLAHGKKEAPHGESFMKVTEEHAVDITHDQDMSVAVHGHRESHAVKVPAGGRLEHKVSAEGTTSRALAPNGDVLHDKKVKRAAQAAVHKAPVQGKATRVEGIGPGGKVSSGSQPAGSAPGSVRPSQPGQPSVGPQVSQPRQKVTGTSRPTNQGTVTPGVKSPPSTRAVTSSTRVATSSTKVAPSSTLSPQSSTTLRPRASTTTSSAPVPPPSPPSTAPPPPG